MLLDMNSAERVNGIVKSPFWHYLRALWRHQLPGLPEPRRNAELLMWADRRFEGHGGYLWLLDGFFRQEGMFRIVFEDAVREAPEIDEWHRRHLVRFPEKWIFDLRHEEYTTSSYPIEEV